MLSKAILEDGDIIEFNTDDVGYLYTQSTNNGLYEIIVWINVNDKAYVLTCGVEDTLERASAWAEEAIKRQSWLHDNDPPDYMDRKQ